ncbi:uncharacterised protein [Colletotrichum tofieldiae]|nr:uncharacterised protein [Colletotrichum tofieldiae]
MGNGALVLASTEEVDRALLVLGLEVLDNLTNGLGVGRNGELADEPLGVLVLIKVSHDGVERSLGLGLLALLLLIRDSLNNLVEALLDILLGEGGDGQLVESVLGRLDLLLLFKTERQRFEGIQPLGELISLTLHLVRSVTSVGDDAADTLGNTTLLNDDEVLDEAGLLNVRTTTELNANLAPLRVLGVGKQGVDINTDRHNTDRVGVRLAKHCANALDSLGQVKIHFLGVDFAVLADIRVGEVLDLLQLRNGYTRLVGEVETQLLVVDQRALLVNVVAEDFPKRVVKDVSTGVVVANRRSPQLIVLADDLVARRQGAVLEVTVVDNVASVVLHIQDLELGNIINDNTSSIGDLATRLGVEVGLVQQQTKRSVLGNVLGRLDETFAVVDQLHLGLGVALDELGLVVGSRDVQLLLEFGNLVNVELCESLDRVLDDLAGLTGLILSSLDLLVVDLKLTLLGHQLGQIHGESKGVIKSPHLGAGELLFALLDGSVGVLLKLGLATVKSTSKGHFLLIQDLPDVLLLLDDLRELLAHLVNKRRKNLGEEGTDLSVEVLASVANTTTQNSADDVSATVVVWNGTVGHGEGQKADVISNDTVSGVNAINVVSAVLVSVRPGAGDLLYSLEQRGEDIGSVVGDGVLESRHEALKAHTGIDVLGG